MNNDRLEAIRARCEAATPGPWKSVEKGNTVISHAVVTVAYDGIPQTRVCGAISPKSNNGDFIAYARADIPFLLAEVERLADALKAKEAVSQAYSATVDLLNDAKRELHEKLVTVAAERDRWKARAEALERAIKSSETNDRNSLLPPCCSTCAHCNRDYESLVDCAKKCKRGSSWEFDEARFAGGEDATP